jgi:hypothetical protein
MKTLNKTSVVLFPLLKEWVINIGLLQIINALAYLLTKYELIEGAVWQVVFPALLMLIMRFVARFNK